MLFVSTLAAQAPMTLAGRVVDPTGEPVAYALVYLLADTTEVVPLAFAETDPAGRFQIEVAPRSVGWLRVKSLGYRTITRRIDFPAPTALDITLVPEEAALEEVVVREKRPPVILRSDTTVYDLDAFRDSTERTVEDLLRKIPEIAISETGRIEIGGRPIRTVLIEDDNVFGRQYELGTRGIRADFIDRVEIIDNYEDNPVLKNIRRSDEIVLNLKMRADKQNIVTGAARPGVGYGGGELKRSLHLNGFSVARKHKFILLSDYGNTGTQYAAGLSNPPAGRREESGFELTQPVDPLPGYLEAPAIQSVGLERPYYDNGVRNLQTLRAVNTLSDRWKLTTALGYTNHRDGQFRTQRLRFDSIATTGYDLFTRDAIRFRQKRLEAKTHLRYLAPDQQTAWQLAGTVSREDFSSDRDLRSFGDTATVALPAESGEEVVTYRLASLWTRQLSKRDALEWRLEAQRQGLTGALSFRNPDAAAYFDLMGSEDLTQRLAVGMDRLRGELTWLGRRGAWNFTLSARHQRYAGSARPDLLRYVAEDTLSVESPNIARRDNRIAGRETELAGHASRLLGRQVRLDLGGEIQSWRADDTTYTRAFNGIGFYGKLGLTYLLPRGGELSLESNFRRQAPPPAELLEFGYFPGPFQLRRSSRRAEPIDRGEVSLSYAPRNPLTLNSFLLRLGYRRSAASWRENLLFFRNLTITSPFLSPGVDRLFATARYSVFWVKSKTNLILRPSLSTGRAVYQLDDTNRSLRSTLAEWRMEAQQQLFRGTRLNMKLRWTQDWTDLGEPGSEDRYRVRTLSTDAGIERRFGDWSVEIAANYFGSQSAGTEQRATAFGTRGRIYYQTKWNDRTVSYELAGYNLLNTADFSRVSVAEYFLNEVTTEAVPRFMVFTIDVAL